MPAAADDDMVVHGHTERLAGVDESFVTAMSALDGVGSPDGWLCSNIRSQHSRLS